MMSTLAQTAIALTQGVELSLLVKATLVLTLGLVAARLAAHARASVRHLLLAATLAALVGLPIAALLIPGVVIQVPVAAAGNRAAAAGAPSAVSVPSSPVAAGQVPRPPLSPDFAIDWMAVARWTWLAGAVALCLSLLLAFDRLRRIRRDGLPRPELEALVQSLAVRAGVGRSVGVLEHERLPAPLTCGFSKPVILLPVDARQWSDAELQRAIVHELEHVRRGDWALQLAARVVCACYWFHPLAWTALRQLCLEAERACDDAVVRGAEGTDYADQLVLLARRLSAAHQPAMLGMANRSDLATRVGALLDDRQRRGRAGAVTATAAVLATALIVIALAPVRAIARTDRAIASGGERATASQAPEQRRVRVSGLDRALYEAAWAGTEKEVEDLLAAGANPNAPIPGDGSALIAATRRDRRPVVMRLLDAGADPNLIVPGDGTALIAAAREGEIGSLAILLDRGALVDLEARGDENALIQASGRGQLAAVKLLVAHGANVNARIWAPTVRNPPGEWRTPLGMARRGGHTAVVEYLVSRGAVE